MSFGTSVVYDILARDRASKTFRDVSGSMAATQKKLDRLSSSLTSTGRRMTHTFTLPIVAAGAASVKMATDFQSAMLRIHTQAGASMQDVRTLSKSVLSLASKAQQSPLELAQSLYHLKSVGMGNAEAMKALQASSKFAALGHAHLEDTTNALAGAWRSGIKGAHNFTGAVATLNAVIGAGNMSMEDLNSAIGTGILPTAKSFGVSMKSVGSALALMTDEGIPAQQAATRLRMSLSLLGAPSGAAEKALNGIGLSGHRLGETLQKPNGVIKAVQLLHDHLNGLNNFYPNPGQAEKVVARLTPIVKPLLDKKHLTKAQFNLVDQYGEAKEKHMVLKPGRLDAAEQAAVISRAFGGGRSSSAIMTMLNNLDVLKKKQEQVNKSANKVRFGEASAKQAETAAAKFALFKSSIEKAAVEIGNVLLPKVTALAGWVGKLADKFNALSPGWQKAIIAGAAFLAVLGPTLTVIGNLIKLVKGLRTAMILLDVALDANPIGILTLAIAALVGGFILAYKKSQTFRNIVSGVLYDVGQAGKALWDKVLRPVFKFIADAFLNLAGVLVNGAAKAFGWVPGIGDKLKKAAAWFNDFRDKVNRSLSGIHDRKVKITADVSGAMSQAQSLKSFLSTLTGKPHTVHVGVHTSGVGGLGNLLLTPAQPRYKRAMGGSVRAGVAYKVGESGSETFIPGENGRILPHGMRPGKTVNVIINGDVRPNDWNDFAQKIDRESRIRALGSLQ